VIQSAAALYQYERGILSGALGLYRTSTQYLNSYRPVSLGLNVEKLLADLHHFFGALEASNGKFGAYDKSQPLILEYRYESA